MKIKDAIREAVAKRDGVEAGRIADMMRFRYRMDYHPTLKLFQKYANISEAEFDALLYEADYF